MSHFNAKRFLLAAPVVTFFTVYSLQKYTSNNEFNDIDYPHQRSLTTTISNVVNTFLSSTLRGVFETRLSGASVKTLSCLAAFLLANVDLTDVERFPRWISDDTVLTLFTTGVYNGLDGIEEYVDFIFSNDFEETVSLSRPYIYTGETTRESDVCDISYVENRRFLMTDELFEPGTCYNLPLGFSTRFRITGDANFVAIEEVDVYGPEAFFSSFFTNVRDGAFAERTCTIMEENCPSVWEFNEFEDQDDCLDAMETLPITEGIYADGLSQGCRWIHSVFASENLNHCPHISFRPLNDHNGQKICQHSDLTTVESVFTPGELSFYEDTARDVFGFDERLIEEC